MEFITWMDAAVLPSDKHIANFSPESFRVRRENCLFPDGKTKYIFLKSGRGCLFFLQISADQIHVVVRQDKNPRS